jgi:nitronate monooxygenase
MLEAERAGAKALVVFMNDWPRNGPEWKALRKVHEEEAHNCALIGRLLEKSGTAYSHATGEFFDKAVAVKGQKAQIEFLLKGLRWAVKRFEEALPRLNETDREAFTRMRDSHLRTIATCEALARSMPG